jgi:hypothetical protein
MHISNVCLSQRALGRFRSPNNRVVQLSVWRRTLNLAPLFIPPNPPRVAARSLASEPQSLYPWTAPP